jgi:hypothetical protein
MMVDTSQVSLSSLVTTKLKKSGHYMSGACPFCGGKDRFVIKDDNAWLCRHCSPKYSDAIEFIQRRDNYCTFIEACQTLQIELSEPRRVMPAAPLSTIAISDVDHEKSILADTGYHAAALKFVSECSDCLMSPEGDRAREYLVNRGIYEAFFYRNILGFNPEDRRETWGAVDVWLPRGIVIPHWRGYTDSLWRINIRRAAGDPKYIQPAGCSNHGLYVCGLLHADALVILVEGEFDAMCLKSQLRNRDDYRAIVVIATGSAHAARVLRNVATLAVVPRVLIATDADKAGDDASEWWLTAIGRTARRARPYEHDITDMYHAGNLQAWIKDFIK